MVYNPPEIAARDIALDYKSGVPLDDAGRLTVDMDGRPLGAAFVAGWQPGAAVGVRNAQAIPATQFDTLAEAHRLRNVGATEEAARLQRISDASIARAVFQ